MVDTPFTTFAYAATGAPTLRTTPDRIADVKSVKDFGAAGDGSADDTAKIQAAIEWNVVTVTASGTTNKGGTVINFSSVVLVGGIYTLRNITHQSSIPPGTSMFLSAGTTTSITLSSAAPVQGGGVQSGDTLKLYPANRGEIYFPAGTYKITSSLDLNFAALSIILRGVGDASAITGSVDGFLIDRTPNYNTVDSLFGIENLNLQNTHTTGGGIRIGSCLGGWFNLLTVGAHHGILLSGISALWLTTNPGAATVLTNGGASYAIGDTVTLTRGSSATWLTAAVLTVTNVDSTGKIAGAAVAVTGAVDNGSGLIRLTFADVSMMYVGITVAVASVGGVAAATGTWVVSAVNTGAKTIDLAGTAFSGVYTSGGTATPPIGVTIVPGNFGRYTYYGTSSGGPYAFTQGSTSGGGSGLQISIPSGGLPGGVSLNSIKLQYGGATTAGSLGLMLCGGPCRLFDSTPGFETCVRMAGTHAGSLQDFRIEVCGTGIALGLDDCLTNQGGCAGWSISDGSMESNSTHIQFLGAVAGAVKNIIMQGFNGAAPGGLNPQYAIRMGNDTIGNASIGNTRITGIYDVAGVSVGNVTSGRGNILFYNIEVTNSAGTLWVIPTKAATADFINCNVAPVYLFAGLPVTNGDDVFEGKQYNISDSATATWGANITVGGSSNHIFARWNGSNWTVVGK